MIERHPFGVFVPKNAKYLLLGSFTTKPKDSYEWFYANGKNQFWPILEEVYGRELRTKLTMQQLFRDLQMALTDIILECERKNNSHLDINLTNIVVNSAIEDILRDNVIEKIYFSSRFTETLFKRNFAKFDGEREQIVLPSPSPRYAIMTKNQKVERYKQLLPKL